MNGEDYFTDEQLTEGIKLWDAICEDNRPGYFPLIEAISSIRAESAEQARKEAAERALEYIDNCGADWEGSTYNSCEFESAILGEVKQ